MEYGHGCSRNLHFQTFIYRSKAGERPFRFLITSHMHSYFHKMRKQSGACHKRMKSVMDAAGTVKMLYIPTCGGST